MENKPRFSLIISVYNAQRYVKACIDSCIQQTMQHIEIICVDDCSTDDSLSILKEYQSKDSRVRVFTHTENKKQGGARNTGIAHANGEYCWIIDSDDIVDFNACEKLDAKLTETKADFIWFNFDIFLDTDKEPVFIAAPQTVPFLKPNLLTNTKHLQKSSSIQPWLYVVKHNIIKNIFFRENVYHEDVDFTYKTFYSAKTAYFYPVVLYHYRIRNGSDMHSDYTITKLKNQIEACLNLYVFIKEQKIKRKNFFSQFTLSYSEFLQDMIENSHKDFLLHNYLPQLKKIEQKTKQYTIRQQLKKILSAL